jgi:hypothetical protein
MKEVRCCCQPENLIGYLPDDTDDLNLRELSDGTFAFDSNHQEDLIREREDFVPAQAGKSKPKTWKKTWKGK